MEIIILVVVLLVLIIYVIGVYNGLIRKRMYVKESWSNIDVQLKRKGNVIPNLVDTIKMQTAYEGDLLEKITLARSGIVSGTPQERINASDSLTKLMPSLYAVSENYPTLKANDSFKQLMNEITDSEDKITYARQRFNICVNSLNVTVQTFPNNFIASLFNFKVEGFFVIEEQQRTDYDKLRIKDIK
jgi:LemA protein